LNGNHARSVSKAGAELWGSPFLQMRSHRQIGGLIRVWRYAQNGQLSGTAFAPALSRGACVLDVSVSEWEQAEISRSEFEALHTPPERLIVDERNVARYLNPPSDTAYPLEYSYSLLGNVSGCTVLDFGCGSGENSLLLARRGAHVVGVDISTALVSLASRRLALNGLGHTAALLVGSAHDLPLPDNSVDGVLGIAILHHLDLNAAS